MKKIVFIVLFISIGVNGQELENKFTELLCSCFDNNQSQLKSNIDISLFQNCFESSIENIEKNHSELIFKDVDTTNTKNGSPYQMGYQKGQELFDGIQEKLINDCDSYYKFSKKLISVLIQNMTQNSSQINPDSLTLQINNNPSRTDLIFQRALAFITVNDFQNAQLDLKSYLEINSTHVPSLFFLGSTYDLEKKPKLAIQTLEKIIIQDQEYGPINNIAKIYLAVLKRNLREKQ